MSTDQTRLICTPDTFRPQPCDGLRWWEVGDWALVAAAHEHLGGQRPWTPSEWQNLYAQGYRYCALVPDGRALAWGGLWPRSNDQWEVIAVGTDPAVRNRGYGRAVVAFVTSAILAAGRTASITTGADNAAMLRTAAAVGFSTS